MTMRTLPGWSRVLGIALALLLLNLFWNDPLRDATGGGPWALLALNVVPSILAIAWIGFYRASGSAA